MPLSLGQVVGAVFQHRVVAEGQGPDEMVGHGQFGDLDDFFAGGIRFAVGNVFGNGAREDPRILKDHANLPMQGFAAQPADIGAVNGNGAAGDFVKAHEEIDDRRFAGTCRTDDGDDVTLGDCKTHILHERLVVTIAEGDMLEFNGVVL